MEKQNIEKATLESQKHNQNPERHIKRTKRHEAILKVKEVSNHIDMMQRRHKYLQVRDDLNRSLTIQHQRKLQEHENRRQEAKKDRESLERYNKMKMNELENAKEKNMTMKDEIQKKIAQTYQKHYTEKVEGYQTLKVESQKNEQKVVKIKEEDLKQKQEKRDQVNQMKEMSKINLSRYKQTKTKQSEQYKSLQYGSLMSMASDREKQLMKLSKMEEQMVKKQSESMQVSQTMKNKLKSILGDDRRFIKLPSIKSNSSTARGSTGNTQILLI